MPGGAQKKRTPGVLGAPGILSARDPMPRMRMQTKNWDSRSGIATTKWSHKTVARSVLVVTSSSVHVIANGCLL